MYTNLFSLNYGILTYLTLNLTKGKPLDPSYGTLTYLNLTEALGPRGYAHGLPYGSLSHLSKGQALDPVWYLI